MKVTLQRAAAILIVLMALAFICAGTAYAKGQKLSCVRTVDKGHVCLTIDDGWGEKTVRTVLDVLRKYKVHCTFFVIGSRLNAMPKVWRQAVADGHEICYHSMTHKSELRMSSKAIAADVEKWEKAAHKALGKNYEIPKLARLPGGSGSRNDRILKVFDSKGYKIIYWSMDTFAYSNNKIASCIERKTKQGAIILTHFNTRDMRALPKYIGWLNKRFDLCTLSEALAA